MFRFSCLLLSAIPVATLAETTLAYSGSWEIHDLLPDTHVRYQDHDIYSVEEGPEEDIIYITKRVPPTLSQGCSDCDYFTPWDNDENAVVVKRDSLSKMYQSVNATQRQTVRRADKNVKAGNIKCEDGSRIDFESPQYPRNEDLDRLSSKNIYDFKPFDRPDQAGYYQLTNTGLFQNRNSAGTSANRAVSVEHILEWQILLDFVRSDSARCSHITKYLATQVRIDTEWSYIDSSGTVQSKDATFDERAIDWVAHQYPSKDSKVNPFVYEFVSLHDGVNGRKERLWSEASASTKKGTGPNGAAKKPSMVDADKWTKWTKQNKYQQQSPSKTGSKRKSKSWTISTNNEGKCNALVALRDIIGVYKYHSYSEIQSTLTAQIDRVGTALKYLEDGPLKATAYKPMPTSLESQWNAYIKSKYSSVIADIESTMESMKEDLEQAKVKRDWFSLLRRGAGKTTGPLCGLEPDKTKMNNRIALLVKEYEAVKGKWKNPKP